jgi:hypothetical protein
MECVNQGGALLLIADHAPYGAAAGALALRFGIEMGTGYSPTISSLAGGMRQNASRW